MAQDLPDDVWSQIAETWLDRRALHTMSLTSRRMHQLIVPELFRYLQFHLVDIGSGSWIMARLIRDTMRARFLYNSPELLRHTRVLAFLESSYMVDAITEYLALRDVENLVAVLSDTIYRLIFRMPGLRDLQISNTVMTPLGYAAISSRPLLTSLILEPRLNPDITYITPALPYALRLRDFSCYWAAYDRHTDPYVADILDHFILELEKLSMSSNLLPMVTYRIPLHHMLSLRSLSVMFPFWSDDLAVPAFFHVLRACPQLRHLSLIGKFPGVEPIPYLPIPILPNLSTFSGTSRLLQILSGGTNLVEIDIHDNFHVKEQSLTQVILSPPTHLRGLSMRQVVFSTQRLHEFLTFIRSLSVFRNLERLDIAYGNYMSWKDHVSAQDSHGTIKDLLNHLPCVRFLNIHSSHAVRGYDIGCPISKEGEPADRGHPSLEKIHVDFLCGRWSWDSRRGWEESDLTVL